MLLKSEVGQSLFHVVIPLSVQLEFKFADGASDVWCVVFKCIHNTPNIIFQNIPRRTKDRNMDIRTQHNFKLYLISYSI